MSSYKGLEQKCYQIGFNRSQVAFPDLMGTGGNVPTCTLNKQTQEAYKKGMMDGFAVQGMLVPPPRK